MTRWITLVALLLIAPAAWAQSQGHSVNGSKYYVAVAVVLIILLGLVAYLFVVDRKISKFERKSKEPDEPAA